MKNTMQFVNKKKSHAFGKDCFLLGIGKDGVYYWLEESTFDCGWYWGIGYVESYTNNKNPSCARDISSHSHFNSLFFGKNKNGYDVFCDFFSSSTLTDKELWKLMELMKSLYTLRSYSDMLHAGGAHYTAIPCKEILKNDEEYNRINNVVIPVLLNEVYSLLSPVSE